MAHGETKSKNKTKVIGEAINRIDGILKVTGAANYSTDFPVKNVAHGFIIKSTIAAGSISDIDTAAAEKSPGVIAVITHKNALKITPYDSMRAGTGILQDPKVNYYGQHIGVVVAETYEQARFAASLIKVTYQKADPKVDFDKSVGDAVKLSNKDDALRGDFESAFNTADHKIDVTYETPIEHHNPMEPHAAIAVWDGDNLTLYSATQVVSAVHNGIAKAFGLKPANVRVISPHVGGGFGSKGGAWGNVPIAAIAAKMVNRPVKLALTRQNMFNSVGLRQRNKQRLRIAATNDGKLTALAHDITTHTATTIEFAEPCGSLAGMMYDVANSHITYRAAPMNIITGTYQRAPGESTGSFALESAMDEIAYALKMDPIEFRLKNIPTIDPSNGKPFSSRATAEALRRGAEMIGWKNRKQEPRQNRKGEYLIGFGVAAGAYPSRQAPTSAQVKLTRAGDDVNASIELAASDIGTGSYTIIAQTAAETLGLPLSKVGVKIGDSTLPPAAGSVGSIGAASFCNAVSEGCVQAITELRSKSNRQWFAEPSLAQLMEAANLTEYQTRVDAKPPDEAKKYSCHAFNANFAEVWVNAATGMVRVARHVAVTGAGKIMNTKTARSQVIGGCVWGIGMALTEESVLDPRWGNFVTRSFADYHIPANLDISDIDVAFIPEEDHIVNKLGIKGIGEVGIVGVAAAVANAVFNATGKRVRNLPITPDKLL
ncbi:MAG TPA: xanthine dehydrogenase family protein molybdopterin-binding subunit [Pyrinomonadaceae bacterium]|nr:xanthine dehydrogenase family protein molybdopterin-binding subunit [Pyrinomonadaceae bacterium]